MTSDRPPEQPPGQLPETSESKRRQRLDRLPGLSEDAARFAWRHPRAAEVAVYIALETAAALAEIGFDEDAQNALIPNGVDG